jgi:putative tricarboxylic transport membrane protein
MKLKIGSTSVPGPGFFPLVIAVIIMGISFTIILKAIILEKNKEKKVNHSENVKGNILKISYYIILTILYGITMERIGFLITSIFLVTLILKYVEGMSWKITLLVGFPCVIMNYILFVYFLGVYLPKGLIKWV